MELHGVRLMWELKLYWDVIWSFANSNWQLKIEFLDRPESLDRLECLDKLIRVSWQIRVSWHTTCNLFLVPNWVLTWGIKLGADFKYQIEQKSYYVEMVRLFAYMVRLLYFWILESALVPFWDSLWDLSFSLRCLSIQSVRPGTWAWQYILLSKI